MQESLETCPMCGAKLMKMRNTITNETYMKCSNDKCHFTLRENYEPEEFELQGKKLKSVCLRCGEQLEVACGPKGLYGRCFHCSYDLKPVVHGGNLIRKWANAKRPEVQKEIKVLIETWNRANEEEYGFDPDFEEITYESNNKKIDSNYDLLDDILNAMRTDLSKKFSPKDINKHVNQKLATIRNYLTYLRTSKLIKVVGFEDMRGSGPLVMLYQVPESPLEEISIRTREDNYITVASFLKEFKDEIKTSMNSVSLIKLIKEKNINFEPTMTKIGLLRGYSISKLKEIIEELNEKKEIQQSLPIEKNESQQVFDEDDDEELDKAFENATLVNRALRKQIVKILKRNLDKPYGVQELKEIINKTSSRDTMKNNIFKKASTGEIKDNIQYLRKNNFVKAVDLEAFRKGDAGFCGYKIQLLKSPLKEIEIIKDSNKYMTLKRYVKEYKKGKNYYAFNDRIKNYNLKKYPIMVQGKIFKGYAVSDLEEIFKDIKIKSRKKKVEVAKEPSPVGLHSKEERKEKGLLGFLKSITNINKKEKTLSEIISF